MCWILWKRKKGGGFIEEVVASLDAVSNFFIFLFPIFALKKKVTGQSRGVHFSRFIYAV